MWVGNVLGGIEHRRIGRRAFEERINEAHLNTSDVPDVESAWTLLKRIDRRRTDDLDVGVVAERIAVGDVPDELTSTPAVAIVVSTIHRAKGLEFDRAVIVEPGEVDDDPVALAEETRVLYVALTRPRMELCHMRAPNTRGVRRLDGLDQRWIRRGQQQWQMIGFELRGEDAHRMDPAGGFVIKGLEPREIQVYIRDMVKPGDSLILTRAHSSESGAQRSYYMIQHEGKPVGVTSERFGGLLLAALKGHWRKSQFPARIEGIFVDSVDTVGGTEAAGMRCGLGPSGIWLRVRPFGLGTLIFDSFERRV
jgi:hypothetical protein